MSNRTVIVSPFRRKTLSVNFRQKKILRSNFVVVKKKKGLQTHTDYQILFMRKKKWEKIKRDKANNAYWPVKRETNVKWNLVVKRFYETSGNALCNIIHVQVLSKPLHWFFNAPIFFFLIFYLCTHTCVCVFFLIEKLYHYNIIMIAHVINR